MNEVTRARKHRARMKEQAAGREARRLLQRARHPKPKARTGFNLTPKRVAKRENHE